MCDDKDTLDIDSVDETIDTEDNTSSNNEVNTPPTIHSNIGVVGDSNTVNITSNNSPLLGDSNGNDGNEETPTGNENNNNESEGPTMGETITGGTTTGETITGDTTGGTIAGGENNTTTTTTPATAIPIGSEGCFQNVIDKQLNPPTQNSKFVGYQVRKQEEAAKTTKIFAFGSFT